MVSALCNANSPSPILCVSSHNISVIVQGDLRPETEMCLESINKNLPDAEVILATYTDEKVPINFDGSIVRINDPGSQIPVTRNSEAPRSNINRQISTTRAGLAAASRPFSLKIRSDAVLFSDRIVEVWNAVSQADPDRSRLVVPSFFSRNPLGISGYLFHVSDWIMFGSTDRLRFFWDAPLVDDETTTWFTSRRHRLMSTPTARQMWSRFTPEQHLTINFARKLGYKTPVFFNERNCALIRECEKFYARELVIALPRELGVALPKYTVMTRRPFQWIDNTLFEDWYRMYRRYGSGVDLEIPNLSCGWVRLQMRRAVFLPLFATRHIVSALALYAIRRRRLRDSDAASKAD